MRCKMRLFRFNFFAGSIITVVNGSQKKVNERKCFAKKTFAASNSVFKVEIHQALLSQFSLSVGLFINTPMETNKHKSNTKIVKYL